ncbi:MAG: hypothetical protein A3C80_03345 [Candidatus Ryanbacteria bacterium RIFCSPHIGHO2_02_FULL_45_43]|uniref:Prepilin-type N-terminal cleavage/methylation domain-containing protein n=1 Tax=Candidatus Ryanbacteria bacterium RIFCSPHIGHO2_01_45_13 TaxID=1802112 RepID=A0A1G2FUQ5_9BACT|nr:MAG: hypothetical protein A2W41_01285 [Candidatus Ryanbacteria bacterium RIFCSPHIGHO2_01_45_13]OGZ41498.1 MAG: hypothetical protein A2718_03610 [Candidatus Ryanbacteria bacterium RIFCSPHIGHO2_01_FULL_44_130]OGZ47965.1 MAG: hypothetical protein A3C80_03345 [Candidatus Ryanbacteria bacterium RIFCSPHIGHO2_02_FULL_45_43]OGZ50101.1 MAG: hypothetical protein A3E55_01210 [Candidatus Ryanbacteria bacterium RIFCSPHIGHO2_12_FULL_44_20]OGZ51103.1 MAG: hypothetical protein A3A17_03650 [Candidatus Ryanba
MPRLLFQNNRRKKHINPCAVFFPKNGFGFTLIEILVAVFIFTIVIMVAVGAIIAVNDASKKARSQKAVINNLDSALEQVYRSIREGHTYHCGTAPFNTELACPNGESVFAFEARGGDLNNPNDQIVYRLQNNRIERSIDGGNTYLPLTAPDVVVNELTFKNVTISSATDPQPKVLITVKGKAGIDQKSASEFNIQTTVSQRLRPTSDIGLLQPGSSWPQNAYCPFNETLPGRIIVNFSDIKITDTTLGSTCNNQVVNYELLPLATQIPPGTYDIILASWDDHCDADGNDCRAQDQLYERIKIELLDAGGTSLYTSGITEDIEFDKNVVFPPTVVGTNVVISALVTEINARIGDVSWPGCNSVVAACVAFDLLSSAGGGADIYEF